VVGEGGEGIAGGLERRLGQVDGDGLGGLPRLLAVVEAAMAAASSRSPAMAIFTRRPVRKDSSSTTAMLVGSAMATVMEFVSAATGSSVCLVATSRGTSRSAPSSTTPVGSVFRSATS
jgi:hypothetical protein